MTNAGTNTQGKPIGAVRGTSGGGVQIQMRFVAIWIALAALMLAGRIFLPQSVELSSLMSILPFAAFLACGTMGQTLVLMARGIDLSPRRSSRYRAPFCSAFPADMMIAWRSRLSLRCSPRSPSA